MQESALYNRIGKAKGSFAGSYNCAQSVALAFADIIGLDEEDIQRVMSGFGYGMGGQHSACGAVSGGVFVISSMISDSTQRDETYSKVSRLIDEFREINQGKLSCLDLVGENPDSEKFHNTCPVLIEQVVRAVDRIISKPLSTP